MINRSCRCSCGSNYAVALELYPIVVNDLLAVDCVPCFFHAHDTVEACPLTGGVNIGITSIVRPSTPSQLAIHCLISNFRLEGVAWSRWTAASCLWSLPAFYGTDPSPMCIGGSWWLPRLHALRSLGIRGGVRRERGRGTVATHYKCLKSCPRLLAQMQQCWLSMTPTQIIQSVQSNGIVALRGVAALQSLRSALRLATSSSTFQWSSMPQVNRTLSTTLPSLQRSWAIRCLTSRSLAWFSARSSVARASGSSLVSGLARGSESLVASIASMQGGVLLLAGIGSGFRSRR